MSRPAKKKSYKEPAPKQANDSILGIVSSGVKDLHAAGVMKESTLRELDVLCLSPVRESSSLQTKRLRGKTHASQEVFAA